MELDRRIGDYAAVIARDADLLMADMSNLTARQQGTTRLIKQIMTGWLRFYNACLMDLAERTHGSIVTVHELRLPLDMIYTCWEIIVTDEPNNLTPSQSELLQEIKAAREFILNAFMEWLNSGPSTV